jgi:hypothetical protein
MTRPDREAAAIRSSTAPRAWAKGARVTRLLDLMPELATELQLLVKTRYAAHDPLHRRPAQDTQRQDPALPAAQPPAHRTRRPGAPLTGMEPLLVEQRGTVRWLLLNRPERRNAVDITIIEALDKQITSAEADPGTAVIAGWQAGGRASAPAGTSTSSWSCTSGATTRSTSWPTCRPASAASRPARNPGSPWCVVTLSPGASNWRWPAMSSSPPTPPSSATVTSTGGWYRPADQASGFPVRSDADFGGDDPVADDHGHDPPSRPSPQTNRPGTGSCAHPRATSRLSLHRTPSVFAGTTSTPNKAVIPRQFSGWPPAARRSASRSGLGLPALARPDRGIADRRGPRRGGTRGPSAPRRAVRGRCLRQR